MKSIVFWGLILLLGQGCGQLFTIPAEKEKNPRCAILPMTVRGPGLSQGLGHMVADRLTASLFHRGQLRLVDRSLVNSALLSEDIQNPYYLNEQQIAHLSDTLKADLLLLGIVEHHRRLDRIMLDRGDLMVTLRLLKGKDGELVKLVQKSIAIKALSVNEIYRLAEQAAKGL